MIEIWNNQGSGIFVVLSQHNDVIEEWRFGKPLLNGLRGDIFSGGSFEDLLFPVGDPEVFAIRHLPNIPCVEPSIRINDLPGSFRTVHVPEHHVGSLAQDFTVTGEFHLHTRQYRSNRTEFHPSGIQVLNGNHRGGFGQPITLHHLEPGSPEYPGQTGMERCSPRYDQPDISSQHFSPL